MYATRGEGQITQWHPIGLTSLAPSPAFEQHWELGQQMFLAPPHLPPGAATDPQLPAGLGLGLGAGLGLGLGLGMLGVGDGCVPGGGAAAHWTLVAQSQYWRASLNRRPGEHVR